MGHWRWEGGRMLGGGGETSRGGEEEGEGKTL